MTATQHTPAASHDKRIVFGGYSRDGVENTVVPRQGHVCNACPSKHRCTDSDRGREIVRPLDPWPHSEAGRLHRATGIGPRCA